jgi:thiol:disulfide interchange protein DsbD
MEVRDLIATLIGLLALIGNAESPSAPEGGVVQVQTEDDERLAAAVVSEAATLTPGTTNWIGLEMVIEPGWHTYWNGRNDTGTPPNVKWTLPEGYKVGDLKWPAPKRYTLPGESLDHVYEGKVLLMAPLEVPASAKAGDTVEIKAACTFVVCKQMCVMEKASPTLTVKVGDSPGKLSPKFEAARKTLPVPLKDARGVSAKVGGGTLTVEAKGAERVSFFPYEESASTPKLLEQGEAKGDKLTVSVEPSKESRRVRGVVEARGGTFREPMYVELDLELPR